MSLLVRTVVGAFYSFCGYFKLFPTFDHIAALKKAKDGFTLFATVFPLKPLGYQPDPELYLTVIGVLELAFGGLLILGPRPLRRLSALVLMGIMVGAIQTLACLGLYKEVPVPAVCLLSLYYIYRSDAEPKPKQE